MSIYEVLIDSKMSTTILADDLFRNKDKYSGIALRSSYSIWISGIEGLPLVEIVLFAVFDIENNEIFGYEDYCTMTDIKTFLSKRYTHDGMKNISFINEIEKGIKELKINSIQKLSHPYRVSIQRSKDYQSFGNYSQTIYITHFMLHQKIR